MLPEKSHFLHRFGSFTGGEDEECSPVTLADVAPAMQHSAGNEYPSAFSDGVDRFAKPNDELSLVEVDYLVAGMMDMKWRPTAWGKHFLKNTNRASGLVA